MNPNMQDKNVYTNNAEQEPKNAIVREYFIAIIAAMKNVFLKTNKEFEYFVSYL